jgi:phosphohistidine phosphatase
MKSLLLIRHAKSSWDFDVDDFERPLNHRGQNDASAMAKKLIEKEITIDYFVSSPAKRAITTATLFAETYDKKSADIITVSSLYEPTIETFYNVILEFGDSLKTVAVFSHNPAITDFANQLTSVKIDEIPTCAIFAVRSNAENWKEFSIAQKELWFFDYPKD